MHAVCLVNLVIYGRMRLFQFAEIAGPVRDIIFLIVLLYWKRSRECRALFVVFHCNQSQTIYGKLVRKKFSLVLFFRDKTLTIRYFLYVLIDFNMFFFKLFLRFCTGIIHLFVFYYRALVILMYHFDYFRIS